LWVRAVLVSFDSCIFIVRLAGPCCCGYMRVLMEFVRDGFWRRWGVVQRARWAIAKGALRSWRRRIVTVRWWRCSASHTRCSRRCTCGSRCRVERAHKNGPFLIVNSADGSFMDQVHIICDLNRSVLLITRSNSSDNNHDLPGCGSQEVGVAAILRLFARPRFALASLGLVFQRLAP
jgi:hypothetical protein